MSGSACVKCSAQSLVTSRFLWVPLLSTLNSLKVRAREHFRSSLSEWSERDERHGR